MGKNVTKKNAPENAPRRYLRAGAMALLVLAGVGSMAGMALVNRAAKPNRDMKWYVTKGEVQIAAPAAGDSRSASAATAAVNSVSENEVAVAAETAAGRDEALAYSDAATGAPEEAAIEPADAAAEPGEQPGVSGDAAAPETAAPETAEPEGDGSAQEAEPAEEEPVTGPVTITITAAGDCTFCGEEGSKGNRHFRQCVNDFGYDYFFENVRYLFESDDLTIVNLEGPLTSNEKAKAHGYVFKADPECVKILTGSSVELCNLANNHSLDYGASGLEETAKILEENGIGYCGFTAAYETVIKGVRVCALGFTKWDHDVGKISAAVAAARENCDLLIVNMHWGWENQHQHDGVQKEMGHAAIDAGADLVIGTHPHVYQGIEKYKGRYIVYSLGNFCFAGNANPADKRCLVFQQSFGFTPGMGIAQQGFTDEGINIIPASISSVRDTNDFRPTVMPAEDGAALLKAVASVSANFSASNTRWMRNNYMEVYGLIESSAGAEGADPGAVPADAVTADEAGAEADADDAGPRTGGDGAAA